MGNEFDDDLHCRLLAFQQRHGIPGGGVACAATWRKLVEGAGGTVKSDSTIPDAGSSGVTVPPHGSQSSPAIPGLFTGQGAGPATPPATPVSPLSIPGEGVDMPWVGTAPNIQSSELGYLRDSHYFWERFQADYPHLISPANAQRIAGDRAPVVDEVWTRYHPEHSSYMNQTLEHHHVGQGSRAVPMPERLHDAYTVFHPQRREVGAPNRPMTPMPPRPDHAGAQAEINRHTQAGRIVAPGVSPSSPPTAPQVPPASAVAGEQARLRLQARGPAGPRIVLKVRMVGHGVVSIGAVLVWNTLMAKVEHAIEQKFMEHLVAQKLKELEPTIAARLNEQSHAVADLQLRQPRTPLFANVSILTTVHRAPGEDEEMIGCDVELTSVSVSATKVEQSDHTRTWVGNKLLARAPRDVIRSTFSVELEPLSTADLRANLLAEIAEEEFAAGERSSTPEQQRASQRRRDAMVERLRGLESP